MLKLLIVFLGLIGVLSAQAGEFNLTPSSKDTQAFEQVLKNAHGKSARSLSLSEWNEIQKKLAVGLKRYFFFSPDPVVRSMVLDPHAVKMSDGKNKAAESFYVESVVDARDFYCPNLYSTLNCVSLVRKRSVKGKSEWIALAEDTSCFFEAPCVQGSQGIWR